MHYNIIKIINHNQSLIDCKNHRTHCRNEWSLRTEQNNRNKDNGGNKKSVFKTWKCTKWKSDTNYRNWKRLLTIVTEPRTYTNPGNCTGENWDWETIYIRNNIQKKLHTRIHHISRTRAPNNTEITKTTIRNTQNNILRAEGPLHTLSKHRYTKKKVYNIFYATTGGNQWTRKTKQT